MISAVKLFSLVVGLQEQFYSEGEFCRYNMFNHHFFEGDPAQRVYRQFVGEGAGDAEGGNDLLVVIDPPFGGLVEVLAFTLQRITRDWRGDANGI